MPSKAAFTKADFTNPTYEDWILLLAPLFGAGASNNLSGILPGTSGLVLGVLVAALGKSLASLGSDVKSYEDWWLFILTFIGLALTGFTGNSQYALGGSLVGFLGKSLIGTAVTKLLTLEDVLLLVGSLIAIVGLFAANTTATNSGILLLIMGKATPSLATGGKPAYMKLQTIRPAPS